MYDDTKINKSIWPKRFKHEMEEVPCSICGEPIRRLKIEDGVDPLGDMHQTCYEKEMYGSFPPKEDER